MQAAVLPWVLRFARLEIVPETVRCLLTCSRKPTILQRTVDHIHMRHSFRVNSNGALTDATFGSIKAAVTIQSADGEVAVTKERVDGLTTSQVSA